MGSAIRPLFLAVMDWAVPALDENLSTSVGNIGNTHLAFADDLVIFAFTPAGLKALKYIIRKITLGHSDLVFNPTKGATFRLSIDIRNKKCVVNPGQFLKCQDRDVQ